MARTPARRSGPAKPRAGRAYAVKSSRGGLAAGLAVTARLAALGLRGVPAPVTTVDGRLWTELDQRGFLAEMAGKRGHDFDLAFANRLRVAHGRIFAVVAEIRATTRNSLVRSFAQVAVDIVMKHMSLLESTGLVAPVEASSLTPPAPRGPITVPLVVTVVAIIAVANLAVAARRSWS